MQKIEPFFFDYVVIVIFVVWLTLTILVHLPRFDKILARHFGSLLLLMMLPRWNFFAPNPGVHDYILLYRDRCSKTGSIGSWHEAISPIARSRLIGTLWNPDKILNKVMIDIVGELDMTLNVLSRNRELAQISIPYLTLLNFVSNCKHLPNSDETQFLLIRTNPNEQRVHYLSKFHRLE